jgi:hypothetical protein
LSTWPSQSLVSSCSCYFYEGSAFDCHS